MLRVQNTLTGRIEPFDPLRKGKVSMYVCGPTVYDDPHIGHGRVYVAFDTVYRHLKHRGFDVTYVRNITDIDDKIIKRAQKDNVSFDAIATRYTESFTEDMRTLGLLDPDHEPKASETIPEIIGLIEALIKAKKAYVTVGDVYFSISTVAEYGKLSKKNPEDLKAGARVDPSEQKRDPLDFALWKAAKPGEPSWPSPWGDGRPGWHIECSAMVGKLHGDSIDIHAGGRDLIFPHHENEIVQSEGATRKPFVKYWLHNGFVNINKEKMSKSLGNIITLKGLLKRFHPEALKVFLLSSHYRSPIDFSDTSVEEAARGLDRIYRILLSVPGGGASKRSKEFVTKFEKAMDDDFNTAQALGVIFDAVKEVNRLQLKKKTLDEAKGVRDTIVTLGGLLGLLQDDPAHYFKSLPGAADLDIPKIESLIAERTEARRGKDFSQADKIRDELRALKVAVEDGSEGTTWRRETSEA